MVPEDVAVPELLGPEGLELLEGVLRLGVVLEHPKEGQHADLVGPVLEDVPSAEKNWKFQKRVCEVGTVGTTIALSNCRN